MKKNIIVIALVAAVMAFGYCAAKAEPQVVTITVLPEATPRPAYRLDEDLPSYKHNQDDVKRIAKLLWSSPLYSESQKERLVWVVLNRCDHFGKSVHDIVNAKEFTFYDSHARISDKNKAIVEHVMDLWKAEKDGYHIGCRPPKNALYVRFCGENSRKVALLDEPSGKELEW